MLRKAAVAGQFYPAEASHLVSFLERVLPGGKDRMDAFAVIAPHAGYPYSGQLAADVYSRVNLPHRFVILCPNHTGQGAELAIMSEGHWETPLGTIPIDVDLAEKIRSLVPEVEESPEAHRHEHSLEVQLPFLQYLLDDFSFVPLCVGTRSFEALGRLGAGLAAAIRSVAEPVLMVSSSDMNHFESAEVTLRKDQLAIDRIIELNSRGLKTTVERNRISMCGFAPTTVVMEASRQLGATRGVLIGHTHSGEVTGENSRVVGYAGIALC